MILNPLFQLLLGSFGASLSELLHWKRIIMRGRMPRYGRKVTYWIVTVILIVSGGIIAMVVSPSDTSSLQLILLGMVGPQFILSASQTFKDRREGKEPCLGTTSITLNSIISDISEFLSQ